MQFQGYPVKSFGGRKRIIISESSWLGGSNSFLGIMYIIAGISSLILWICLLVCHRRYGVRLVDGHTSFMASIHLSANFMVFLLQ